MIDLFESFSTRRDVPLVKYAATTTKTVEFLPSKLIEHGESLWPDMHLQHQLVEVVARYIDRFPRLVNFYWHQPLGYGLDVDREGKDAIIELWKKVTALPDMRRIYILELYAWDFRTWGGHIRHFECLRNFANKQSLYESQDVGKRKPKYVKIDEAFIEEVVQAGPPQVYKVDPPTVLPLFQWDVEGFQPIPGFHISAHYFIESRMPEDCEMY